MIKDVLFLYWAFSVLFMIGYVNAPGENIRFKLFVYFIGLIMASIMFPINIGYYIRKNS